METGDSRVKEETGNDERCRRRPRQAEERSQDPEKLRDDGHMQTGDGKEMQGSALLKGLLDVVRRLVPEAERHAVDQRRHLRRIFQVAGEIGAHPVARAGGPAHDGIAASGAEDDPVFRVTHEDALENILPREVGAQIEDARVARRGDRFRDSGEPDFVAQPWSRSPTRLHDGGAGLGAAVELERVEAEEEGSVVVRRMFRFARDHSADRDYPGPVAEARAQFAPGSVVQLRLVQGEVEGGDEQVRQPQARPGQANDRAERDRGPEKWHGKREELGQEDAAKRGKSHPRERLPAGNCEVHGSECR